MCNKICCNLLFWLFVKGNHFLTNVIVEYTKYTACIVVGDCHKKRVFYFKPVRIYIMFNI